MEEKTKMRKKVDAKGITLIALIITIIVMLILVGVTLSVALNGGIISKAQEAKTKTEEAQKAERDLLTGRIKVGDTWYDSLDEYLKNNPSEDQSDEPSKWGQDEDGNITYDGEKSELKVGDYVDYEKYVAESSVGESEINKLYDDLETYSGFSEYTANNSGKIYSDKYPLEKEELKWRVLDIKDGRIRLISEKTPRSRIYLAGYNGYNNAVYLIDKVCRELYSTEKGTAQNLKIEDIEDKMNLSTWDFHEYIEEDSGVKYRETNEYTGNKSYYPEIFAQEKNSWVDDNDEGTLDLSDEPKEPINQGEARKAVNKIKVTQSHWESELEKANWKNAIYQDLLMSCRPREICWLSSRCVIAGSSRACFCVCTVNNWCVDAMPMRYSDEEIWGNGLYFRPVVTLNANTELTSTGETTWSLN